MLVMNVSKLLNMNESQLKKLLDIKLGLFEDICKKEGENFAILSVHGGNVKTLMIICQKENIDISEVCKIHPNVNINRIISESYSKILNE